MDPWFVTGFINAAGSFTYSRSSGVIAVYFSLKLSEADSTLLLEFREFFTGIGSIYGKSSGTLQLRVNKTSELQKIIKHLDKYQLQGVKKKKYEIWRKMVFLKSRFRRVSTKELEELARTLSAV